MKKLVLFGMALLMIFLPILSPGSTAEWQPALAAAETNIAGDIFMHIGSPLILAKDTIFPLDPDNPDVAAVIENQRTLIPLHAVSEYFNAKVSYDAAGKKAIIEYNKKKFIFPIGKAEYSSGEGKRQQQFSIDTAAKLLNGSVMVPLKVVCENILGLQVSYHSNVISISDKNIDLKKDQKQLLHIKSKIGSALKVQSMEELKASLVSQSVLFRGGMTDDAIEFEASAAPPSSKAALSSEDTANSGFSSTNIQVAGIDEADIVKTDGKNIFIAGNSAVHIVKASGGNLEEQTVIKLPENKSVVELYIDGSHMVLVGTRYDRNDPQPAAEENSQNKPMASSKMLMPYYHKVYSFIDVYDISNPGAPAFVKSHEMEGNYQTSRKKDSMVYIITNRNIYSAEDLPMMRDSISGNQAVPLALKDIMIMPGHPAAGYVIVSAVDITGKEASQVEAIATSGYLTYMNSTSLYLAANNYTGMSSITKFNLDGAKVVYAGSGQVEGYILNQFSMDEHNGYFRVATTSDGGNNLFILDSSLNKAGAITGLAKGERIYSVRFMGDKGYVVTFRNIDPLFVFDLSNPFNPIVTGELKIPGFSNYLHPVGEDLILGIGQDTYEIYKKDNAGNDVVIGSRQGGIKLSLFDVSDMGKPQEISKYVLGDSGSYADVLHNHKAAMFDYSKNYVIFDASYTSSPDSFNTSRHGAVIFNYGGRTLELKGVLDYIQPEISGIYTPYGRRTVYIGDTLYYIQDGIISSYDYETLKLLHTLQLK